MKGAVPAQKALLKIQTRELLGGIKENSILPDEGSLICLLGKLMIFTKRSKQNKIALVARPG